VPVKHFGDRIVEDLMQAGVSWDRQVGACDVNTAELEEGVHVEREHSRDPVIMAKISLDHLGEHKSDADDFDRYYTGLSILEQILEIGGLDLLVGFAKELGIRPKLRKLSPVLRTKAGVGL
jgi:hypothetical protein